MPPVPLFCTERGLLGYASVHPISSAAYSLERSSFSLTSGSIYKFIPNASVLGPGGGIEINCMLVVVETFPPKCDVQ